jgi:hypothetical protein
MTTKAGIDIPSHLPLLDPIRLLTANAVADRALCLNVTINLAYGFDRSRARDWLSREGLMAKLTGEERDLLDTGEGDTYHFKAEAEALWALVWSLNIADRLDFWAPCANDLVHRMPNLDVAQSSEAFRKAARLRSSDEVLQALDLAYCLHWAVRQAQLERKAAPGGLDPLTIEYRRHALEWLAGDVDWDEVAMDT